MPDESLRKIVLQIQKAGEAAGAGGGGADDAADEGKKNQKGKSRNFFKSMKGAMKGGLAAAGVSFSLASMLKQSQVFTGMMGSIFQIIGAMFDVFLAPIMMPLVVPLIKWMSSKMPEIQALGIKIGEWVKKFVDLIANKKYLSALGLMIEGLLKLVWKGITGMLGKILLLALLAMVAVALAPVWVLVASVAAIWGLVKIFGTLGEWWSTTAWPALKDGFKDLVEKVKAFLGDWLTVEKWKEVGSNIWESISNSGFINSVKDALDWYKEKLSWFTDGGPGELATSIGKFFGEKIASIKDWFKDGPGKLVSDVKTKIGEWWDSIVDALVPDWLKNFWSSLTGWIGEKWDTFTGMLGALKDKILGFLPVGSLIDMVTGWISDIVEKVKNLIPNVSDLNPLGGLFGGGDNGGGGNVTVNNTMSGSGLRSEVLRDNNLMESSTFMDTQGQGF